MSTTCIEVTAWCGSRQEECKRLSTVENEIGIPDIKLQAPNPGMHINRGRINPFFSSALHSPSPCIVLIYVIISMALTLIGLTLLLHIFIIEVFLWGIWPLWRPGLIYPNRAMHLAFHRVHLV